MYHKHKALLGDFITSYKWNRQHGLLLLVACTAMLFGIRQYVDRPLTGDEPHYLLMTQSLIQDGDLNLKNNFEQQDYLPYYPNPLSPKGQVKASHLAAESNKWYSIHSIGIPVLLVPAYVVAKTDGAIFMMVLFAVMTVWLTYVWVLHVVGRRSAALFASFMLATSFFLSTLAGYLYPDILMPLLLLTALLIIEKSSSKPLAQVCFGIVLGLLILIHFKSIILVAPLALAMIYKTLKYERKLPWLCIVGITPFLAYFIWSTWSWFGILNPAGIYQDLNFVGKVTPWGITTALLFDARRGLFVYNPVYLLLVAGLPIWWTKSKESLMISAAVATPYLVVLITFWGWFGGDAPSGRYIMDILPIFMPAVGFAFIAAKSLWQKITIAILVALTLLISGVQTINKVGYVSYITNNRSELFVWLEEKVGFAFDRFLPTFSINASPIYLRGWLRSALLYCFIGFIFLYAIWYTKNHATQEAVGSKVKSTNSAKKPKKIVKTNDFKGIRSKK